MRTRRRCWGLAAGGLATLALHVSALAVLSYLGGGHVRSGEFAAAATRGKLVVVHSTMQMELGPTPGLFSFSGGNGVMLGDERRLYVPGLTVVRLQGTTAAGFPLPTTIVNVPLWLPLGFLLLAGAFCGWRWRACRRVGGCPACGYDTRGLGGRCPECGLAAPGEAGGGTGR